MREIGGYIELDRYTMPLLHEGSVALNCGRNALVYLIRAKKIRRIKIPRFLCDSVMEGCKKGEADVSYYAVGDDFLPRNVVLKDDEWLYLVNYYGQVDNGKIQELAECYKRVIVDNAQAYFQEPVPGQKGQDDGLHRHGPFRDGVPLRPEHHRHEQGQPARGLRKPQCHAGERRGLLHLHLRREPRQ